MMTRRGTVTTDSESKVIAVSDPVTDRHYMKDKGSLRKTRASKKGVASHGTIADGYRPLNCML